MVAEAGQRIVRSYGVTGVGAARQSRAAPRSGAHGSLVGDGALLEKWFRDIKVYDIFEGTGQIQRIVIAKRLFESIKSF